MIDLFAQTNLQIAPAQSIASSGGLPSWAWFIIIVLIILVVWWLLVRSAEEQNEIHVDHVEEHVVEASPAPEIIPLEKTAKVQIPDDLTLLEGIGPKVNSILAAAGITTFSQVAETDVNKLKEILDGAGFKYMDPTTWPQQASFLAEGKNEEFEKLVSSLRGGRKK